jgi:hypothetical protein
MCPRPRPHCGRVSFCDRVRTCRRWDCINVRQRERAKEARFAACTSLLTSPATRRMPPKCGAFPVQPRRSPLRQTACWRKADSNSESHRRSVPGIAWVPEPLFGRLRALDPVTASSVAAPCHSITDEVSGVGQAPRLTALSPARRATHSGAAGYIRFYASTGGVSEAVNVTGWWPAHRDREA